MLKRQNTRLRKNITRSKKATLIETDRVKNFYTNIFQNFLKKTILKFNLETHSWELFLQKDLIVL